MKKTLMPWVLLASWALVGCEPVGQTTIGRSDRFGFEAMNWGARQASMTPAVWIVHDNKTGQQWLLVNGGTLTPLSIPAEAKP